MQVLKIAEMCGGAVAKYLGTDSQDLCPAVHRESCQCLVGPASISSVVLKPTGWTRMSCVFSRSLRWAGIVTGFAFTSRRYCRMWTGSCRPPNSRGCTITRHRRGHGDWSCWPGSNSLSIP